VERGASVSVLTGVPHYPGWTVDPASRWRLRRVEKRDRFEVRRLRHYVPKKQTAIRRALYELSFALQVALQRPQERPDVVLAVVPSLLSAVVAQRIAARAGVPLVVWVQDLMGRAAAQSGIEGGARVARAVGSVEKWVLQRADQVLVLNSHFADYVRSIGVDAGRLTLRPNWTHVAAPSGADPEQTRARLKWSPDETIVLHTGNMGLKQGLENVIAAARLADDGGTNNVRFVLMGDGSQRKALQREAEGVAAVEFLSPAPSSEYADILAAADVLLVNERPSSVDMSLPSKLTSYLRAGRPIIAASPCEGGTAAEVVRSGGGLVVEPGNPEVLLDAVKGLVAAPKSRERMGKAGRFYAEEHLDADRALQGFLANLVRTAANANWRTGLR
jgi:glycosyltransferase involved in cell wall biosynthesis